MTKPITTFAVTVAPAATVTERLRPPLDTVKPSPVRRGRRVVRLLYAFTWPVSSLPVPVVAYGEVARSCRVVELLPLFLIDRLVTATLLSVMNLVWFTVTEPPVCTLFQWLGICRRWETCSVKVPG